MAVGVLVWLLGARDELEEKEEVLLHAHLSRVRVRVRVRYCSTRT